MLESTGILAIDVMKKKDYPISKAGKINIQLAKRKDFKKVAEIYIEGFSEPPFNESWSLNKALKKIKLFSKYCDIWSIKENKKVVGFIIINSHLWNMESFIFGEDMAIKKEYRRKNIATIALKHIMVHYKKRGYKKFLAIINRGAKSYGLIKKLNMEISKEDLLVEKQLK